MITCSVLITGSEDNQVENELSSPNKVQLQSDIGIIVWFWQFCPATNCLSKCIVNGHVILANCSLWPLGGMYIWRLQNFRDFLPPSPLVCILDQFIVLNSRNLPYNICFWGTPLPPPTADIICTCPLTHTFVFLGGCDSVRPDFNAELCSWSGHSYLIAQPQVA